MPKCKFCENEVSKLVKAHIIPKAFFEEIKKNDKSDFLLSMTNTPGRHTQKSWIGLYDKNLVCISCEKLFAPYDDYAINLLLKTNNFEEMQNVTRGLVGWKKDNYDYNKLKMFFLTLLWRAGASEMIQFKEVKLGIYLNKLREDIKNNNPGMEHNYSILLARFEDYHDIGGTFVLNPHLELRKNFDGLNCYRFYLGAGYIAYIKVDKRIFAAPLIPLILNPNNPLYICNRGNIKRTKELPLLRILVAQE